MNDYGIMPYNGLEVRIDEHGDPWLSQGQMAELFQTTRQNVSQILKYAFEHGEMPESQVRKMSLRANDGKEYQVQFYDLDAILMVGFRVHQSGPAIEFRKEVRNIVLKDWRQRVLDLQYDRDEYRDRVLELEREVSDLQQDLSDSMATNFEFWYPEEI
jgi:hypothetical protein